MNKLVSISLKVGLVNSLFLIVFFLTIYFMGNIGVLDQVKFYDFWMPAIFIFIALKFYRDKVNGKELRMWQGLAMGLQITAINAVVLGGFIVLFMSYIAPDYLQYSIDIYHKGMDLWRDSFMEQNGMTLETFIQENPRNFKESYEMANQVTIASVAQDKMIFISLFGLAYTFVLSIFLRRNAA